MFLDFKNLHSISILKKCLFFAATQTQMTIISSSLLIFYIIIVHACNSATNIRFKTTKKHFTKFSLIF